MFPIILYENTHFSCCTIWISDVNSVPNISLNVDIVGWNSLIFSSSCDLSFVLLTSFIQFFTLSRFFLLFLLTVLSFKHKTCLFFIGWKSTWLVLFFLLNLIILVLTFSPVVTTEMTLISLIFILFRYLLTYGHIIYWICLLCLRIFLCEVLTKFFSIS